MRVRYQMVGSEVQARCDLPDWQAKQMYKNLFSDGLCEWAELVGEVEENYMDVLEAFDHVKLARSMAAIMEELKGVRF